ncbi:MAG: DJ-1/PfpI family protein [Candidatus Hydrogenedentes bacterium]|nr:DJ-1/PfpI family protein [Candidatus Hydrogenedentota bacterium]
MPDETTKRTLGVLLYPDFELLDVFGPVEMFGNLKDHVTVLMVAENAGPVESFQRTKVLADHGLDDCPKLDLLLVPGGWGMLQQLENERVLTWLRERASEVEIVMSVCSGSGILARAGLLDGRPATTNKQSYDTIVAQGPKVDWIREARWVDDGDIVTSSGVSAGMDMALAVIERLYGADTAGMLANLTEYERQTDPTKDPFAKIWT